MTDDEKKDKKKVIQVGESLLEKRLGRLPLVSFRLVHGKKIIEPWKGQDASILEWMRSSSAMLGDTREEIATFVGIEKDSPIYFEDSLVADMKLDIARFSSDKDGRPYDLAARLVPRSIKPGDRLRLSILGCCSIINVEKASTV